jgi:hypothetical protein
MIILKINLEKSTIYAQSLGLTLPSLITTVPCKVMINQLMDFFVFQV